jgi:tetraacyldisaccharide 4'-kinase
MTQTRPARPLLAPLVPIYRLGLALRETRLWRGWEPERRLRYPVISIGNLSTGGSGKTPFAIALTKLLMASGFHVDVLSRGYGRKSQSAACVRPEGTAEEFGDEPLLIARETGAEVYVAPQRYDAGQMAEAYFDAVQPSGVRRPAVHILDDGFQHRQLVRDVDFVLLNQGDWHDQLLPAGNLREPVRSLGRADCVAIPADQSGLEAEMKARGYTGAIWCIHRRMEVPAVDGPVAAFCGIARPEQFFAGLEAAGLRLAARTAFRDHHNYSSNDVAHLVSTAKASGASALITTEKDRIRLESLVSEFPEELPIKTARLQIEIEDQNTAIDWLTARLATRSVADSL